jgi:RNA polymerase sigma factor (sigma-70 family)
MRLSPAQQELVERNLNIARVVARTFLRKWRRHLTIEDLDQLAMVGLCRAAASYDPAKGYSFSGHAWRHCRWHLLRWLPFEKLVRVPEHALDTHEAPRWAQVPASYEGGPLGYGPFEPVAPEPEAPDERIALVRAAVARLPRLERETIEAELSGKSQDDIARERGRSRGAVSNHHCRGVRRLRYLLGAEEG